MKAQYPAKKREAPDHHAPSEARREANCRAADPLGRCVLQVVAQTTIRSGPWLWTVPQVAAAMGRAEVDGIQDALDIFTRGGLVKPQLPFQVTSDGYVRSLATPDTDAPQAE
ncbi:MAG: hypothetical protein V4510_02190 [bacterium]